MIVTASLHAAGDDGARTSSGLLRPQAALRPYGPLHRAQLKTRPRLPRLRPQGSAVFGAAITGAPPTETGPCGLDRPKRFLATLEAGRAGDKGGSEAAEGTGVNLCSESIRESRMVI